MVEGFLCTWLLGVICPHKKCACNRQLPQCSKCPSYAQFLREMDEEDEKMMDWIEEVRRTGVCR